MTEEELKKKEAELAERETKLTQGQRGLASRLSKVQTLHNLIKDRADVVKALDEIGIKKKEDLDKLAGAKETKTQTQEEDVAISKDDMKQIMEGVRDMIKEEIKGVKQDVSAVRATASVNQVAKDLKAHFDKAETSHIKNYFEKDPDEVANAYMAALEQNNELTIESFSEEMNKSLDTMGKKAGIIPEEAGKKEEGKKEEGKKEGEKKEGETEVNLDDKGEAGSGGTPTSSTNKSEAEIAKMSEEEKDKYFVEKAAELDKEDKPE